MKNTSHDLSLDFGPLAGMIGTWSGDKGMDIAPDPDGKEENPFYETIVFQAVGDVENAETQVLVAVHYHQLVSRKSDDKVFHNETGYWMWDAEAGLVMHSLQIPRGVGLIAGGHWTASQASDNAIVLEVAARHDDPDWQIVQSPFMRDHARTLEFRHKVKPAEDSLMYEETTTVDIYGRIFEHTDQNELLRSGK